MSNAQHQVRRRVRGQWIAFAVLLCASLVLMGLSRTGVGRGLRDAFSYTLQPVTSGLNEAADSVGSIWNALLEIDHLRSDNEKLREENEKLRNELARMPAIEKLDDDWSAITQTQQEIQYQTTPARVIARSLAGGPTTFLLDKGSNGGIRDGDVVIAKGGALVGRVVEVHPQTSLVLLTIDAKTIVIGKAPAQAAGQSRDATGQVTGQVGELLQMSDVDAGLTLLLGSAVTTAGYSAGSVRSPYPAGLLIGYVVDWRQDANGAKTATLSPAVDFHTVDFVLVITNYEGGILAEPSATPAPSATSRTSAASGRSGAPAPSAKPSPTR